MGCGSIGNPKGQQRMFKRMVKAAGPFLLFHDFVPANVLIPRWT
jgi:hypothetical protein